MALQAFLKAGVGAGAPNELHARLHAWEERDRKCSVVSRVQPWRLLVEGARDLEELNVAQGDIWKHFVRLAMRVEYTYRRADREGQLDQYVVTRTPAQRKSCMACLTLVRVYEAVLTEQLGVAAYCTLKDHFDMSLKIEEMSNEHLATLLRGLGFALRKKKGGDAIQAGKKQCIAMVRGLAGDNPADAFDAAVLKLWGTHRHKGYPERSRGAWHSVRGREELMARKPPSLEQMLQLPDSGPETRATWATRLRAVMIVPINESLPVGEPKLGSRWGKGGLMAVAQRIADCWSQIKGAEDAAAAAEAAKDTEDMELDADVEAKRGTRMTLLPQTHSGKQRSAGDKEGVGGAIVDLAAGAGMAHIYTPYVQDGDEEYPFGRALEPDVAGLWRKNICYPYSFNPKHPTMPPAVLLSPWPREGDVEQDCDADDEEDGEQDESDQQADGDHEGRVGGAGGDGGGGGQGEDAAVTHGRGDVPMQSEQVPEGRNMEQSDHSDQDEEDDEDSDYVPVPDGYRSSDSAFNISNDESGSDYALESNWSSDDDTLVEALMRAANQPLEDVVGAALRNVVGQEVTTEQLLRARTKDETLAACTAARELAVQDFQSENNGEKPPAGTWHGDCARGDEPLDSLKRSFTVPFSWDPAGNIGTCTGLLPAPRVAHMGRRSDTRDYDLEQELAAHGHDPAPTAAPRAAAFIATDQGCHRRVEQFKADGTLQNAVCVLGTLHVLFAFIKSVFQTFDPILRLAKLVEEQLNVKLDRGEHVIGIANGHCDFTSQVLFEVAVAMGARRIAGFVDDECGDEGAAWWAAEEAPTDAVCDDVAQRLQEHMRNSTWGVEEGAPRSEDEGDAGASAGSGSTRLPWVEWEFIKCVLDLYAIQVGRRNGSVGAMAAAIRDVCEFMHSQPGHPKKREELISILLEWESMGWGYYMLMLLGTMSVAFRSDGSILEGYRSFFAPPDGRVCGDEYIEVVNHMLKRLGLRQEQSVREFCAMLHLSFDEVWKRLEAADEGDQDEEAGTSNRQRQQADKVLNPHKPSHLEFEHRHNSMGTMISLRMGLDKHLPSNTQVPDNAASLRPASVHGRALMMHAAGMRRYMQKRPTTHKKTKRAIIVTAASAITALERKQAVHSRKQYQHCRKFGCRLGAACTQHIIKERLVQRAQEAADRAARDCLPSAADIANMTVPQLKTVCKALNIKPMPSTKDALRNAVNGYVTAGDDADVVVPISAA